ncbi:spidroin-1-like [Panthera pardus]|uniref:Spidroin-1-like n=1 Tax=Panthera pardus TaxID=9691 RepID=A0A9W2ULE7_PANPR|nr:spidroin-1-like [Panthera pardus]
MATAASLAFPAIRGDPGGPAPRRWGRDPPAPPAPPPPASPPPRGHLWVVTVRVPQPPHLGDDQRFAVLAAALQGEAPWGAAAQLHLHQAPAVGRPRVGLGQALGPRAGLGALHGAGRGGGAAAQPPGPVRPAPMQSGEPRPAEGEGRSVRSCRRRPVANLRGNLGGKCRPGPGREPGAGGAAHGGGRAGQGAGPARSRARAARRAGGGARAGLPGAARRVGGTGGGARSGTRAAAEGRRGQRRSGRGRPGLVPRGRGPARTRCRCRRPGMRVRARGSPRLPRGWKGGEGRRAHGTCASCRCGSAPRLAPLQSCPEGGRGRSAHSGPRAAPWGRGAAGDREANSGPSSRASAGRPLEAPGAPALRPGGRAAAVTSPDAGARLSLQSGSIQD